MFSIQEVDAESGLFEIVSETNPSNSCLFVMPFDGTIDWKFGPFNEGINFTTSWKNATAEGLTSQKIEMKSTAEQAADFAVRFERFMQVRYEALVIASLFAEDNVIVELNQEELRIVVDHKPDEQFIVKIIIVEEKTLIIMDTTKSTTMLSHTFAAAFLARQAMEKIQAILSTQWPNMQYRSEQVEFIPLYSAEIRKFHIGEEIAEFTAEQIRAANPLTLQLVHFNLRTQAYFDQLPNFKFNTQNLCPETLLDNMRKAIQQAQTIQP